MASARMRESGATRIHAIRVRVGALSSVVPESLEFAFEALADETPAAGGRLILDRTPGRFHCPACGVTFETERFCFECPTCHASVLEWLAGRELELVNLEVS